MLFPRSLMFVPWVQERCLDGALSIPADLICVDLEESVAPADKATAREMVEWARYQAATGCRASGVLASDAPEMDLREPEQLERDGRSARSTGHAGKQCIDPTQVELVKDIFLPSWEEIAWALRIVASYEEAERRGVGAVALGGLVVDRPVYVRAQRLLEPAQRQAESERE